MKGFLKLIIWLPLLFPLYLFKGEILGLPLNALEAIILFFFAVFVLWGVWKNFVELWKKRNKLDWLVEFMNRNRILVWGGLIFTIIVMLSIAITPGDLVLIDGESVFRSRRIAWGIVKGWLLLPLLYFVMLYKLIEKKEELMHILKLYIVSGLPLIFWALYQFVTGDFITMDERVSGPFINANYLAMYLAPAGVALCALVVEQLLKKVKVQQFLVLLAGAVLYSFVILLTHSYGAIIGSVLAILIYLMLKHRDVQKLSNQTVKMLMKVIIYFVSVMGIVAIIVGATIFVGTEKWQVLTEVSQRSSSAVRLQVYEVAVDMIERSPILGIGLGQFEAQYNLQAPEILGQAPYEWVMLHPHNTYLAFWLNLGVLGLAAFLVLVVLAMVRFFRSKGELRELKLIGLAMLVLILAHGMVDTYFFKNDLALIFWTVMAVILLPKLEQKK